MDINIRLRTPRADKPRVRPYSSSIPTMRWSCSSPKVKNIGFTSYGATPREAVQRYFETIELFKSPVFGAQE